jgi:hypothetical protein
MRPAAKVVLQEGLEVMRTASNKLSPIAGGAAAGKVWSADFSASKGTILMHFLATLDNAAVNEIDAANKDLCKASLAQITLFSICLPHPAFCFLVLGPGVSSGNRARAGPKWLLRGHTVFADPPYCASHVSSIRHPIVSKL